LLDTMGELSGIYHLADAVFIGGSLVPKGGHNILEPALFGKPILFGSHMNNFKEMANHFLERQAALQVNDTLSLSDSLIELAQIPSLRNQLGLKAGEILAQNRGATRKVLDRIEECLKDEERQKTILPP
jgi:3-deoxy-D-manno-octulosonic-acid transferase